MKDLIYNLGRVIGLFYSESLSGKWNACKLYWRAGKLSRQFAHFGKHSTVGLNCELKGTKYISVGNNVKLGNYGILTAWDHYGQQHYNPQITIGDDCNIGQGFHITCVDKISIGNNVQIGKNVLITDNNHISTGADLSQCVVARELSHKPCVIEDNVWLGGHVCVLQGVTIGKNSIIGAGSVVTSDVPPNSIYAGNPAKSIH